MIPIHIAVTGCGHGELDVFYRMCKVFEEKGKKIDLLIITGDFQAMRNQEDLGSMNCPVKYKHMMNFYKYYSGKSVAPIKTIYIGGNHEASNYHKELHYGGWVAPNIYFMGHSNIIRYKGLKIGGISGIYNPGNYKKGYYERVPFDSTNRDAITSAYHYRQIEISKLLSYKSNVDIMISHDWPSLIYQYGDVNDLLKKKPFFKEEVENGCLGSPPLMSVLKEMKPSYWFASHLHVKYSAIYNHEVLSSSTPTSTRFLSLDKCVRRRDFMQVVTVMVDEEEAEDCNLYYDSEWLGIVVESQQYLSTSPTSLYTIPTSFEVPEKTKEKIQEIQEKTNLRIPSDFTAIAPAYSGSSNDSYDGTPSMPRGNDQTDRYLEMLGLEHVVTMPVQEKGSEDPNEVNLDDLF